MTLPRASSAAPSVDEGATTSGRSLLSGSLWNGLNTTLPQLYTLVQSVVAARVLGPVLTGNQSYIAWVAISVKMIMTGGMPVALMRYVGELIGRGRPGAARALVGWAFRLELLGAAAGAAIVLGVRNLNGTFTNAWTLAALVAALTTLHTVPYGVLIGIQRWRQAAAIGLTLGGVGTVATVAVLVAGGGITGMFAVEAFIAAVSLAWTSAVARRSFAAIAPASEPDKQTRRDFNGYAAVASVIVVFEVVVWKRSEFLFLERYGTATALANYSVAFAMATAIAYLPQGMAGVLSPAIASLYGAGAFDRIRAGMGRAIRLVATLSFPIAAGTFAIGPTLLQEIYGEEYAKAGKVLLVLMTSFPFVPLGSLGTSVVHGFGRVRLALSVVAVAAVLDIGTAIAVVPAYGAVGAAIANSVAQVAGGGLVLLAASRVAGPFPMAPMTLLRAALASAVTGLAAWSVTLVLGGILGVLGAVIVGLAVFPLLLLLLRGVTDDDARWLRDSAGERLGGLVGRVASWFVVDR